MNAVAVSYWRSIKRGIRTYFNTPDELRGDVKELARMDAANGVVSAQEYTRLIGEDYQ